MDFPTYIFFIMFFVALLAGYVDAVAGGGGMLTVPALLSIGLPPSQAIATNKLQGTVGSLSSTLYFLKKKLINLNELKFAILFTFIGGLLGSITIQIIHADFLLKLIPILLIIIAFYFLLAPKVTSNNNIKKPILSNFNFALIIGLLIGFYDGFFGPGTGSFFAIAFVFLMKLDLVKATAKTKILNFTANLSALIMFILGGAIIWKIGLVMAIGQFIGAQIGAKMVVGKGTKFIRPMVIVVSLIMAFKLIVANF